jgi:hypothetical protein
VQKNSNRLADVTKTIPPSLSQGDCHRVTVTTFCRKGFEFVQAFAESEKLQNVMKSLSYVGFTLA